MLDRSLGAPADIDVRALGLRLLVPDGWQWISRHGKHLLKLGGAADLDSFAAARRSRRLRDQQLQAALDGMASADDIEAVVAHAYE